MWLLMTCLGESIKRIVLKVECRLVDEEAVKSIHVYIHVPRNGATME